MPVARIITRSPELSESLANQLRAHGYSVETVSPEQGGRSPAELEIIFDTYAVQEALGMAAKLAQASEVDVYIARGVYPEPAPAENDSAPAAASHAAREEADRAPAAAASVNHAEPVLQPPVGNEAESERGSLVRDGAVVAGRAARDLARSWGAAVSAAGRQVRSLASGLSTRISERRNMRRQQRAQAQQQQLLLRQQKRQRVQREQERRQVPQVRPTATASRPARSNMLRDAVGALGRAAGDFAGQLGEAVFAVAQRVSEWRVARLQRSLADVPRLRRRAEDRLPVIRRTRERDSDWKVAAVFSGILAVAVMVAWAAANRRPASPLPVSVLLKSTSMEQQVPFGPVTLRPSASPAKPAQLTKPAKPSRLTKPAKPSPQKFSRAKAAPSGMSAAAPMQHVRGSEVGDEVVVRHYAPASSTIRSAQSSGSIRRYTDE